MKFSVKLMVLAIACAALIMLPIMSAAQNCPTKPVSDGIVCNPDGDPCTYPGFGPGSGVCKTIKVGTNSEPRSSCDCQAPTTPTPKPPPPPPPKPKDDGVSDVALLTFAGLLAVWLFARLWPRRRTNQQ